ncbi:MAG TPA: NeuD/PglB/VioB family sugar acetyltransferase [Bacteroidales bacterium]|nr:NeuD/PglB/VioB family sugar acetyltransferase [Bacteroidales bacterium]
MKQDIILVGSGGHAKVVVDIMDEMGSFNIVGITSKELNPGSVFQGYPVLGNDSVLSEYQRRGIKYVAMGIGGYRDNSQRKNVFEFIKALGLSFINIIHPSAIVSKTVKLGEGVVIFPGAVLNTDVFVGNNTIIATGSTIDHETEIGNHVLVSAGVTVGAYSKIEDNVLIALGAKIISGVYIKANALVAAGAVVVKDVEKSERVFGIPAKPLKNA